MSLFTTQDLKAKLEAERRNLAESVLETPPSTWEAFQQMVGRYAGLKRAEAAIIELERKSQQEETDDQPSARSQPRSSTR